MACINDIMIGMGEKNPRKLGFRDCMEIWEGAIVNYIN
jgi:hypothetical protein